MTAIASSSLAFSICTSATHLLAVIIQQPGPARNIVSVMQHLQHSEASVTTKTLKTNEGRTGKQRRVARLGPGKHNIASNKCSAAQRIKPQRSMPETSGHTRLESWSVEGFNCRMPEKLR